MKLIFTLCCFLLVYGVTYSQNKIYLRSEVKDGKVIEITPGEIKYSDLSHPGQVNSVPRNNALLLFNDKGGFLVVSKPDSASLSLNKNLVDNFINFQNDTINADRIFTRDKKMINCSISNEDILSFIVNVNGEQLKVDKSAVAVVIYKNGEHKLTSNIATATDVLYSFQMQMKLTGRKRSPVVPVPSEVKVITKENENLEKENSASPEKGKSEVTERTQPLINTEQATAASNLPAGENDKRYFSLLVEANSLYRRGEYLRAKYFYLKANELKPNEREPLDGIDRIDKIFLAADKLKQDSVEYDAYVATGDSLANSKNWDSALLMYNKAKVIRPQEYYVNQSIKYVQSEISRLKIETAKKEAELKFNNAMARADIAVKEKRYEDALAAYNEALIVHPGDQYAIDRAKILTHQISIRKKTAER